jgi:hypothetical protein
MNDGKLSFIDKDDAPKGQPFMLSLLMNLALLVIFIGPWIWASLSSTHVENPLRYLQDTFHSAYDREKLSWNEFRNHGLAPHTAEAAKHTP